MTSSLYEKAERFLIDAFTRADKPTDTLHGQRTAYWITQLQPEADEALLVAGLLHDIERAINGDWKNHSDAPELLQKHSDMSAEVATEFLRGEGAVEVFIERVRHLISRHEVGGDEDQNVLCDADCLAFFEEKALRNAKKLKQEGREAEMRHRLDYVLSRITSSRGREIARPFYDDAHRLLDS
jgi:hypothetical protein